MKILRLFLASLGVLLVLVLPANRSDEYPHQDAILGNYWKNRPYKDSTQLLPTQKKKQLQKKLQDSIIVVGVGDLMLGTNYPHKYLLPPQKGRELMTDVQPIIWDSDVAFGNLAGPILDKGGIRKHCGDSDNCFAFRTPEKVAESLLDCDFDVLNIGNNHINDFGRPGIMNTVKFLKKHQVHFAGLDSIPYTTFQKNGIRYGFAAFTPYDTITVNMNDSNRVSKIIRHLDKQSDIVIVSIRAGGEGSNYQRVTKKREYFAGENRGNIYAFAHHAIDQGADIIFGHGPHVSRAVEVYNNRFIAYSLGNFCTYSGIYRKGVSGMAPLAKVIVKPNGEFISAQLVPTKQLKNGKVIIDSTKQVVRVIRRLTQLDFPKSNLQITHDGWVLKRPKKLQ